MEFHNVEFITSASTLKQFPDNDLPEICLAGRSNVGKSSLINTLVNRKNMAYVGKTPGKTRLLNFFIIDNRLSLVDVPGYGYANRSQKELVAFGKMMDDYFDNRKVNCLLLIVDYRHKPTSDDVDMIEYAKGKHLPIIVVATKKDKVKSSELIKNKKLILETLNISETTFIPFSSLDKIGIDELWKMIDQYTI